MKTLLTAAWRDDGKEWLDITRPRMQEYAEKHGYVYKENVLTPHIQKHPSWYKLDCIELCLEDGPVLWVDADLVIVDTSKDIMEEMQPHTTTGFVMHNNERFGATPCIGFWVVLDPEVIHKVKTHQYKPKLPGLRELEPFALMLGSTQSYPMSWANPLPSWVTEFPYEWNQKEFPNDSRGVTEDIRCFHATGSFDQEERVALLKKWIEHVK